MWMHNQFINQIIHAGNKFTTFIMFCSMFNVIDMNWTIHTFMTFTKLYCFLYGVPWRTINNFLPIHINYLFIDVSLSFQSASHSFSVLAPRDGVMTYLIIEVLRESNSSCGCYATVLPLHQSTRPASLFWLSTTFGVLSRVEHGSYHITVLSSGFEPKSPLCDVLPYTN